MHRRAFRHYRRHPRSRHHRQQMATTRRARTAHPRGRRCHSAPKPTAHDTGTPMTDVLDLLLEPQVLIDPALTYTWLRAHHPVSWSDRGRLYVLSRHADIKWALTTPHLRSPEPGELSALVPHANRHRALRILLRTLPMTNPPVHTRLRRLVQRDFTARRVLDLWESTEQTCHRLLDHITARLRDGEIVDVHESLSKELALTVIADLLGVLPDDRPEL